MKGHDFYSETSGPGEPYTWVQNPNDPDMGYQFEECIELALTSIEGELINQNLMAPRTQDVSKVRLRDVNDVHLPALKQMLRKHYPRGVEWDDFEAELWPGYVAHSEAGLPLSNVCGCCVFAVVWLHDLGVPAFQHWPPEGDQVLVGTGPWRGGTRQLHV